MEGSYIDLASALRHVFLLFIASAYFDTTRSNCILVGKTCLVWAMHQNHDYATKRTRTISAFIQALGEMQ